MSEEFEWFDPFEQRSIAKRETERANVAFQAGRRQVEGMIERAVKTGLKDKLEAATENMAERIARKVVYSLAAKMAYSPVASNFGPAIAAEYKLACNYILGAITTWPEATRVRATVETSISSATETMTMEFEVVQPVRVAVRFEL